MDERLQNRIVTPGRLIVGGLLALLVIGILAVLALSWMPQDITVNVRGPTGEAVFCDVVIDGRAESHLDTAPVSYSFRGHQLAFAVIPVEPSGEIKVGLTTSHGDGFSTARGVEGTFEGNHWGSSTSIGGMSPKHIQTMRAASAARHRGSTRSQ